MPTTKQQQQDEDCTEGQVWVFIENIPDDIAECLTRHVWPEKARWSAKPLNAAGEVTRVASKVRQIEYIEECDRCGEKRHHIYVINTHAVSPYWWTDQNPLLKAPKGVRKTGVSVGFEVRARGDQAKAKAVIANLRSKRNLSTVKAA